MVQPAPPLALRKVNTLALPAPPRLRVREELKRVSASSSGFGSSRIIEILASAGAHAGDDASGMGHVAVGENANLLRGGANQFNGADGALRILCGNIDDDNFRARILNLAQNGVGRSGGKPDMAEDGLSQACGFETILQRG